MPEHALRSFSWFTLFQARLSRRIVLWVFGSIVVIEGIILIPSVYRREQELLHYQAELARARATGLLQAQVEDNADPQFVLNQLAQVQTEGQVVGGAVYDRQGLLLGTFGESPQLTLARVQAGQTRQLQRSQRRYDALWDMSPLAAQYQVIIRHDVTPVRQEVIAFIGRIAGLVLLISGFVTVATLIVLEPLLITPILQLRRDLLQAGQAAQLDQPPPELASLAGTRSDELGDVITAFGQMFQQVQQAIAEQKQMEGELRLSETKFSRAFRSSPTPMAISTLADGKFIEVNDSFLHTFGYQREEVTCQTALDLGLWAQPHDRAAMIAQLRQTGMVRNQEYRFCAWAGTEYTMLYSAERIDINRQDCMLSVFSDISDRKRAESALQTSEARFRTLIAQAADAFYLTNAAGQILDVNQQACDQLGYSRAELLALTVPDIQQQIDIQQYEELWHKLDETSETTVVGRHCRRDGATFPVEVRVSKVDVCGNPFLLALARDITDRYQAQQTQQRLAELGEFSAMIVHEVRNPLTTIWLGLTSLQTLPLEERYQHRLTFALAEADRLKRLLNEILLYARGQRLECELLDLRHFLPELIDGLRDHPNTQHCAIDYGEHQSSELDCSELDCELNSTLTSPGPAFIIQGDRDKLQQAFTNLITNACEATAAGDRVSCRLTVSLPEQRHISASTISAEPSPLTHLTPVTEGANASKFMPLTESSTASTVMTPWVEVVIFNPGEPIAPDIFSRLTEPFFTTKSAGNGLGLAITQQIVHAHGGQLQIESSLALGGTQVTVLLPLEPNVSV